MAGGPHNPPTLHMDPALLKWQNMTVNRHKYFRPTPYNAWVAFAFIVVVPGLIGVAGYMTEGKWEMRGKRRGDLISEF